MSIQFGDILGHNNPNYPIADVTDVKGGLRIIANFSNIDLYNAFDGIPEKLKQNYSTLLVTNTNKLYYLSGNDSTVTTSWTPISSGFSGSGTTNSVTKWLGQSILGDSIITDDGDTITINGNLLIIGTTSTVNSENLIVKDPIMLLAGDQLGTPTMDSGLFINRGTGATQAFIWDESSSEFSFFSTTSSSTTLGNVSIGTYSNVRTGALSVGTGVTSSSRFSVSSTGGTLSLVVNEQGDSIFSGDTRVIGATFSASYFPIPTGSITFGSKTAIYSPGGAEIVIGTDTLFRYGWKFNGYQITNLWGNAIEFQNPMGTIGNLWIGSNYTFAGFSPFVNTQQSTLFVKGTTASIMKVVGTGATWSNSASIFLVEDSGKVSIGPTFSSAFNARLDINVGSFGFAVHTNGSYITSQSGGRYVFYDGATGMYDGNNSIIFKAYSTGTAFKFDPIYSTLPLGYSNVTQKIMLQEYTIGASSSNNQLRMIELSPTINKTGTASGIDRGIYIKPTLTNDLNKFRSIEVTDGEVMFNTLGGYVNIGSTQSIIGVKLFIQSSTSSTTIGSNVMLDLYNGDTGTFDSISEISFSQNGQPGASQPYNVGHRYALITGYAITGNNSVSTGGIKFSTRATTGSSLVTSLVVAPNGSVYNDARGSNTLYGLNALLVSTGTNNTAIGSNSLYSNTTGGYNSAVGYQSLYNNTTGDGNSAFGVSSLYNNTAVTSALIITDGGSGYTASSTFSNVQLSYISGSTANIYPIVTVYVGSTSSVSTVTLVSSGSGFKDVTTIMGANLGTGVTFSVKLSYITTGSGNTALGYQSLFSNTSGGSNNSIGYQSMYYNTTGTYNTTIGSNSLYSNTTGGYNSAVGYQSMYNTTSTLGSGFVGSQIVNGLGKVTGGSGYVDGIYPNVSLTYLSGSTAISYPTGVQIVVSGGSVTSVTLGTNFGAGFKDLSTIMTAPASSIGGSGTGFSVEISNIVVPNFNTAIGYGALYSNKSNSGNTAVGFNALSSYVAQVDGPYKVTSYQSFPCTAVGANSLSLNTTGKANTAVGYNSLLRNTTGEYNTVVGDSALFYNSIGSYNTIVGKGALYSNTNTSSNTAIGYEVLYYNTGGYYNIAIGNSAMNRAVDGSSNIALGMNTLNNLDTGGGIFGLSSNNIAIGNSALFYTSTGQYNIGLGPNSLLWNKTGSYNIGIGYQSLNFGNSGNYNTALGEYTLYKNNKGDFNVAIGKGALNWNTSIIATLAATFSPGSNYTPGTYSGIPLNYKSGPVYYPGTLLADFPLADIIVGPGGTVSSVTLTNGGSVVHDTSIVLGVWENGYSPYGLPILPGVGGSGFRINIASVTPAGTYNTALGVHSLYNVRTGSYNLALGSYAGSNSNLVNATASIYIGYNANSTSLNVSNEIVIGYGATGSGSNSVTLGADTITKTKLRGIINLGNVPQYGSNGLAISAGLVPGDIYQTPGNALMVVV